MAPPPDSPLIERFPALRRFPRASLGRFPSPATLADTLAPGLWFKREDLNAEPLGGNKVRALEFLLGGVGAGDTVATLGAAGSTHALATAIYARRLGARVRCFRWRQEMNPAAQRVAARTSEETGSSRLTRTVAGAYARAFVARLRGAHWVPAGGSSPLGVLGQVNAGLELARQIEEGALPLPDRVVVPLGTGGTVAGLTLGFAIANVATEIVAVRVVPRLVANARHVRALVARTARLIERAADAKVPRPDARGLRVVHEFYGGAYGRATKEGDRVASDCLARTGIVIDPTYGAKALAAAVSLAHARGGTTLFWLSFDGRWMAR
jgi:1-aminocyclopropane-1-carboxylate deaminase/D-cysteine desulfhydrase-like pyridoxal-dependent ACC family enzyme